MLVPHGKNIKLPHAIRQWAHSGQPFMEFLPIMINKVGVVIALEVISGMLELSCNPVSLHPSLGFPFLNALFFLLLLILCAVHAALHWLVWTTRIALFHNFLSVDSLPKKYRTRYRDIRLLLATERPFSRGSVVARERCERSGSCNLVYVFGQ